MIAQVEVDLEVTVVRLIQVSDASLFPEPFESGAHPEALIAGPNERIRVHAQKKCPYFGSVGERGVLADGTGHSPVQVQAICQKQIENESGWNQHL